MEDYLREIMEETEIASYISNYLPSFPHINQTLTQYIHAGKDVLIKDDNDITLLESWFNNCSDIINNIEEQNAVLNLLFDKNTTIPNKNLTEKMLNLIYTNNLFELDLEKKTEEQKKHFILHFDLSIPFEYNSTKEEGIKQTSWLHLFLSNNRLKSLIPIAQEYHPDFIEGLKLKNESGLNIAHRICFHMTRLPWDDETVEEYLNLLHTIKNVANEIFEESHIEHKKPYDYALHNIGLDENKFESQKEKILSFFLHRKLENKVPLKILTNKKRKV